MPRKKLDVRSAEVGFNFQEDTLNSLPLERTYRGLFQLIPGVADNRSPVGPAAGGSRQDNLYLLDGADIAPVPPHRRPINMMFQSYALFPHLSVAGNIAAEPSSDPSET